MEDNIPYGYGDPKNTNDIIRFGGPATYADEETRLFWEREEANANNPENYKKHRKSRDEHE